MPFPRQHGGLSDGARLAKCVLGQRRAWSAAALPRGCHEGLCEQHPRAGWRRGASVAGCTTLGARLRLSEWFDGSSQGKVALQSLGGAVVVIEHGVGDAAPHGVDESADGQMRSALFVPGDPVRHDFRSTEGVREPGEAGQAEVKGLGAETGAPALLAVAELRVEWVNVQVGKEAALLLRAEFDLAQDDAPAVRGAVETGAEVLITPAYGVEGFEQSLLGPLAVKEGRESLPQTAGREVIHVREAEAGRVEDEAAVAVAGDDVFIIEALLDRFENAGAVGAFVVAVEPTQAPAEGVDGFAGGFRAAEQLFPDAGALFQLRPGFVHGAVRYAAQVHAGAVAEAAALFDPKGRYVHGWG